MLFDDDVDLKISLKLWFLIKTLLKLAVIYLVMRYPSLTLTPLSLTSHHLNNITSYYYIHWTAIRKKSFWNQKINRKFQTYPCHFPNSLLVKHLFMFFFFWKVNKNQQIICSGILYTALISLVETELMCIMHLRLNFWIKTFFITLYLLLGWRGKGGICQRCRCLESSLECDCDAQCRSVSPVTDRNVDSSQTDSRPVAGAVTIFPSHLTSNQN